jgi:hypothetical protein
VPIRPEAERKLRAGFQRHVDQQNRRYAVRLSHAEQMAVMFGCGEVVGVYNGRTGGRTKRVAYVYALIPIAAIPVVIAAIAVRIPGAVIVAGALPFVAGPWFAFSMWRFREPKRKVLALRIH